MKHVWLWALFLVALLGLGCNSGGGNCQVDCGQNGSCGADGKCHCAPGFSGTACQVCAPQCTGKMCGDNGCGGTCGTCPGGGACSANGLCNCTPRCTGKMCGDDGCGGSCGTCSMGNCTSSGRCCVPNCAGKTCGDDGCGGLCGRCTYPAVCIMGNCGMDNGLACVQVSDTCSNDADCGGTPNRCTQVPVMTCGQEPTDCGTMNTICRSVLQCWRSCTSDQGCMPSKPHCLSGICQACVEDSDCRSGHCVNANGRDRCGSAGDCTGVALNDCK